MGKMININLICLLLSITFSSITTQFITNNVSDDYHTNASFYGLQVTRRGELLTFQSYWSEVIIVNLPQKSEYEKFLKDVDVYCNSMNTKQFEIYEKDLIMMIGNESRAQWMKREMRERCLRTKHEVRDVVNELVEAAFKLSMPQPNSPQLDPLTMITDMRNFRFGMEEDEFEDENMFQNVSFAPQQSPLTATKVEPVTQVTDVTTSTQIPLTESSYRSELVTSTQFIPRSTETFTYPPDLPPVNLSSSPYVEVDYDTPNSATNSVTDVREKRAIVVLSIVAVTAIAGLLAASVTGAAVSIDNRAKINQMQLKVKKLIDLSEEQDNESVALREFMIGMTNENVGKFNRTGSVLSNVLQIQKIFSRTINNTASTLRLYSKGDALANTMFLNLHEEQDFITKVTAVIEGARRVIRNYEQGIISLYQNQLSTAFVSHQQLKSILFKIRHNLPPGYNLAFDMGELENYYFYRLCHHTKVGNQLILRLTVPLSTEGITAVNPLFTPVFNTVPVPRTWEKQMGVESNGTFYRLNEKALYWLLKGGKFVSVIDRDHLSCQEAGNYLRCIRFEPTPSIIPSHCVKLLMEGNFSPEVIFNGKRACKPYFMPRESYKVLRLDDETMVIHGSTHLNYRKICRDQKPEQLRVAEDVVMKIVPLEPGCQIEMNGILFPGPVYQGVSNTTLNMSAEVRDVIFDDHTHRLPLPKPVNPIRLPAYNITNLSFSPSELTSSESLVVRFERLKRETAEIKLRVETYNETFADEQLLEMAGNFHIEKRVVQHMNTILLLIIAFYSYANRNFLVLTAARFSLMTNFADAHLLDTSLTTVNNWYNFMKSLRQPDWEMVIQIACLTFIICNALIKNTFNETKLLDIFGKVEGHSQFNILLTLESCISLKCCKLQETITILYPLRTEFVQDVTRFECLTPIRTFRIVNEMITLSKPLLIHGINSEGVPIKSLEPMDISFALRSVQWFGAIPDSKMNKGGLCRVTVITNPYLKTSESQF